MAQAQPEWAVHEEGEKLIAALVKAQPRRFGHIDPTKVGCAMTTKPKPESQDWDAQIQGIKDPMAKWCEKLYCIVYFKSTWDGYTAGQRERMFFRLLERIHEECNGKLVPFSLVDSRALVMQYGVNYMYDSKVPSLLEQELPIGDEGEEEK
jgi:hypothetical protein